MPEYPQMPLRVGTKGQQTIYDASPTGDGGQPGRSLGRMDTPELAAFMVAAVNDLATLRAEVARLNRDEAGWENPTSWFSLEYPLIAATLRAEPDAG
jgi:hypothetical protein